MKQYRARRPNPHLAFPFGGAYLPSYYSPYGYGRVVKEEMADMANNCSFLGINDKDEESILDTIFRKDSRKRLGKKTRKNTLLKKKDRRSRIRSGTWRRNLGREALAPMDAYDAYLYYEQQAAEKYANEMPEYARMGAAHVAEAEGDNGNEVEIDEEHFPLLFLLLFHLFPVIDEEAEFFPFIDEEAEAEDTEPESDEEYNDDTENGSQTDKEDSNAMGGDVEGYFVDKDDKEAEAEADERTDDK